MQPVVLICFFLSGVSGLILEIVWTRLLEHIFGATTLAVATVLACFMGGLALGSWTFGRLADKIKRPLLSYAIAEIIIGITALAIPHIIEWVYPSLNRWMVAHLSNNFWVFSVVRFLAVAGVLFIPATCMGATLPLLSRFLIVHRGHLARVGARIGTLYTINTTGAVLGVFAATFLLLPTIGLLATNRVAGTINIVLGLAIISAHRWLVHPAPHSEDIEDIDLEIANTVEGFKPFTSTKNQRVVTLIVFFLSGLASMNLQVVWNRAMSMIIGGSVYAFSLVLIAFLVGLAAGAAVFAKISRRFTNPILALCVVEICVAGCAMLNYLYMDDLPRFFALAVTGHIEAYAQHVGLIQFLMFFVAALAVLPATFFMGATFPLTVRIVSYHIKNVGRDVGNIYAVNTMGAIAGSFLSAFVFVPVFSRYFGGIGMQITFYLSVILYAVSGVALWLVVRNRAMVKILVALAIVGTAVLFIARVPRWDPAAMTIGVFRLSLMKDALDEDSWGDPDVKYYYDGVCTTVSVELWGRHFALKNNGKVDASNGDDMPTQITVAALPLLFHPRGANDLEVAIIGFGSGVTVGTALEFPVKKVEVVELENAVVEASRVFGAMEGAPQDPEFNVNHLTYRNPVDPKTNRANPQYDWTDPNTYVIDERLTLYNNDGRNFLASSTQHFDIIVSEPSNPWITGVANMFTRDNFQSALNTLRPDGIYCQWVQLYELSPENIKTILRTFASVFPHVALFSAEDLSSDTMLLGSFSPLEFNLAKVKAAMANPKVSAELERAYLFSATDVFARVLLVNRKELLMYTDGALNHFPKDSIINTDDNAAIEFSAPKDLISFARFAGYLATIYTNAWQYGRLRDVITGLQPGAEGSKELAQQAISLLRNGRKNEATAILEKALTAAPDEPAIQKAQQMISLLRGDSPPTQPEFSATQFDPALPAAQRQQLADLLKGVYSALQRQAHREALDRFAAIPNHLWQQGPPQLLLLRGYLYFLNADPVETNACKETIDALEQLVRDYQDFTAEHPEIFYYLALCHDNVLHFDKATKHISAFVGLTAQQSNAARIILEQNKANLAAALRGHSGTMPIPLPPDAKLAPTTDGVGESTKDFFSASRPNYRKPKTD